MNPYVNYNGRPILKFKLGQFVCVLLEHTKRQPIQFFPATETSLCACLLIGALTARSWGPKPIVHQQPQKEKKSLNEIRKRSKQVYGTFRTWLGSCCPTFLRCPLFSGHCSPYLPSRNARARCSSEARRSQVEGFVSGWSSRA